MGLFASHPPGRRVDRSPAMASQPGPASQSVSSAHHQQRKRKRTSQSLELRCYSTTAAPVTANQPASARSTPLASQPLRQRQRRPLFRVSHSRIHVVICIAVLRKARFIVSHKAETHSRPGELCHGVAAMSRCTGASRLLHPPAHHQPLHTILPVRLCTDSVDNSIVY